MAIGASKFVLSEWLVPVNPHNVTFVIKRAAYYDSSLNRFLRQRSSS